ncbi:MAG: lipid-A-disaccharide synthase [Gammaproteobacteria bacterium]
MKRVMIIAGEASGDLHAAKLVNAVKAHQPDIKFYGIGGEDMREAGVEVMVDAAELAVVGLVEIWAHRKVIFGALDLRQRVDMMAVVFPFEEKFYQDHGVPVEFVGHPLVDEVRASADRDTLRHEFRLDSAKPVIGLFPGSRRSEIKRLLSIILQSAACLQQRHPDAQFLLPLAPGLKQSEIQSYLAQYPALEVQVIQDRPYDVMRACDLIVTVSGTVTLEIALIGTPLVIINKVAWLTYLLVHRMVKIRHIGLCNIVADKRIAPELIQFDATPEQICQVMHELLEAPERRAQMSRELGEIENLLGKKGGIENTARLVTQMITE